MSIISYNRAMFGLHMASQECDRVRVAIEDMPCMIGINRFMPISVVDYGFVTSLGLEVLPVSPNVLTSVLTIDNEELRLMGEIWMDVQYFNTEVLHEFYIVESLLVPATLGFDFLRKYGLPISQSNTDDLTSSSDSLKNKQAGGSKLAEIFEPRDEGRVTPVLPERTDIILPLINYTPCYSESASPCVQNFVLTGSVRTVQIWCKYA
jgi:hypothetical protein